VNRPPNNGTGDGELPRGETLSVPASEAPLPPPPRSREARRYAVGSELARGGHGRVLEAHDNLLDRSVALKEPVSTDLDDQERFVREVAITARLQHPAIIPVHDAGEWADGSPYYVMKLLRGGRTLKELVIEAPDLAARLALLPNLITVADAIAYAHNLDIIHRDLKPSNILVGPFGETVVIDWGLAKDLSCAGSETDAFDCSNHGAAEGEVTTAGTILGTPQFMAPEQASGAAVDKRADVYALGAILYYVLGGGPPHTGASATEVLDQVTTTPPIPIERRQAGVPEELATIVRKATARLPDDRYASAAELAADLKRFQTGQLVNAHEYSAFALLLRRVHRQRAAVSVAVVLLLALAATLTLSARRIVRERDQARRQEARAEATRDKLILAQARSSLEHDPTTAIAWLKTYPSTAAGFATARDIAVDAESRGVARYVFRHRNTRSSPVAFSPDGSRFATQTGDQLRVMDLDAGVPSRVVDNRAVIAALAFSPDGRLLAYSNQASSGIRILNLQDGSSTEWSDTEGEVLALQFSPDSRLLASGDNRGRIRVWTVKNGQSILFRGHREMILDLKFSPDGKWLASAGTSPELRVWTVATGAGKVLVGHTESPTRILFVKGGTQIASASWDHSVRLWDPRSGLARVLRGHSAAVLDLALSPDGEVLASVSIDGTVRLWSLATGESRTLLQHLDAAQAVAFAPDGKSIAVADGHDQIIVSDLEGRAYRFVGHVGGIMRLTFSPDGAWLASTGNDRSARVWKLRPIAKDLVGHKREVWAVTSSVDGKHLISVGGDETVRRWDSDSGQSEILHRKANWLKPLSDGRIVVAGTWIEKSICLWSPPYEDDCRVLATESVVRGVDVSADGQRLAAATADGLIHVWSLASGASGAETVLRGGADSAFAVAFLPDGEHLVSAGQSTQLRLWNLRTHETKVLEASGGWNVFVKVAATGEYFAIGSWSGTVELWSTTTLTRRVLKAHEGAIESLEFSPDGAWLLSGSDDCTVRLWSTGGKESRAFLGHTQQIQHAAFLSDGLIGSVARDGVLRIWDQATGHTRALVRPDAGRLNLLAFFSASRQLAFGGVDGVVHLRSLDELERLEGNTAVLLQSLTTAELDSQDQASTP
jgi:WD40 repeat protein